MKSQETLGQRLQRLRAAAGLTQKLVAQTAGVPLPSLQSWEVDRREPGFRAAVRLAEALGVAVEVLADTIPKDEADKVPRPAGPTRRAKSPAPKRPGKRK